MSLRKNLSATAVASMAGLTLQAATAPAFLAVLSVAQFSTWVFTNAIGSYVGQFANGVFYNLMNEMTINAHRGDRDRSTQLYNDGFHFVALISGLFVLGLGATSILCRDRVVPSMFAALALASINLTSVLFDANFRSISRFSFGTNLLSFTRVIDWSATFLFVFLTRSVYAALLLTLAYRAVMITGVHLYLAAQPDSLRLGSNPPGLRRLAAHIWAARGQLWLSATTAGIAMGPQIVVGALFPGLITVCFNVYRTYMRLLAAIITTGTAAAWPIINQMYAEHHYARIRAFMRRGLVGGGLLSLVCAVGMLAAAPFAFHVLFHNKVPIVYPWLILVSASVLISIFVTISQSFFLSTNAKSLSLPVNAFITATSLTCVFLSGRFLGFTSALCCQVCFDIALAINCFLATERAVSKAQVIFGQKNFDSLIGAA